MLALFLYKNNDDVLAYYSPIKIRIIYRSGIYVFKYIISRDITQLVRVKNF